MKALLFSLGRLVAALGLVGVLSFGTPGPVPAQWPNYMLPDKKEKPKESKPPAALEPGPQGTSKHGWGAVQKSPGAKGSQSQGWQPPQTLGHDTPSKPKHPARTEPQTTKGPKGPPQPKGPKTPSELDFSTPERGKTPASPPAGAAAPGFSPQE